MNPINNRNNNHPETLTTQDSQRVARLNNADWKRMTAVNSNVGVSEMIPGNRELGKRFKLAEYNQYLCTGFSSEAQKLPVSEFHSPRIANLWYVRFLSLHPSLRVDFLRSGSIVHYGEDNPQRLNRISTINLQQLIHTARVINASSERKEFKFLNLDLQSGTLGAKVDGSDLEHRTVSLQKYLLMAERENDTTAEIQSFNLPTHEETASIAAHWQIDALTTEQIKSLATRAFTAIDPEIKGFVQPAMTELFSLLEQQDSENKVAQRFGLISRLAVIASLGGWSVHFNCRSGKDRTGFLDVEIKFLTYQIWRRSQGLTVSAPGEQVLAEEKEAWKHLLLETGNDRIQELNTGLKGSKLDQGALKERVGEDLWKSFIGNSRLARV